MSTVFCHQCGHGNPPDAAFCSSCGAAMEVRPDQTLTLSRVDPLQSAAGGVDDIHIPVGELAHGEAVLIVRNGANPGLVVALEPGTTTLGRHPDSDIMLDDITVSRRHATVTNTDGQISVSDAGSLNGTYVNAERVDRANLHPGDELQVGKFRMLFYVRSDV